MHPPIIKTVDTVPVSQPLIVGDFIGNSDPDCQLTNCQFMVATGQGNCGSITAEPPYVTWSSDRQSFTVGTNALVPKSYHCLRCIDGINVARYSDTFYLGVSTDCYNDISLTPISPLIKVDVADIALG